MVFTSCTLLCCSFQTFSKIVRPVRSLENLKICSPVSKSSDKRDGSEVEKGAGQQKNERNGCDSSILRVTSPTERFAFSALRTSALKLQIILTKVFYLSSCLSKDIVAINHVSNHLDTDAFRMLINDCVKALRTNGILLMREYLHGSRSGLNPSPLS